MTDRSNYQRVGIETDDASFAHLTQKVNEATSQSRQIAQANIAVADSATQAGTRLQEAFSSVKPNIDGDIQSIAALRAQLTGAATDAGNLGKQINDSGGGGEGGGSGIVGARRTGAFLTRIGLPEIGQPLQIVGGLQSVDKTIESIGLSATKLTETGGAATAVISELGGDLGVVTVAGGLAVAAISGIVLAAAAFKSELDKGSEGLGNAVTYVDDYYKAIEKGTTDSINLQLKELQGQQIINQEKEKTLQASYDAAHPKPNLTNGQDVDFGAALTSVFSDLSGGGKQLNKDLEDTKTAVKENDIQQQALKAALGDSAIAANDAAAAEAKLQAARDKSAESSIQTAVKDQQLVSSGSSKAIEDRIAAINAERSAIYDQLSAHKVSEEEAKKLTARFTELSDEQKDLTSNILPLVQAREKETAAEKDALKVAQDKLAADKKQQADSVAAFDKYTTAVQSAEDSAATARINANQKLQDALVNAAQKAVDDANKALEQLTQKRQDNLTSLDRDLSKEDRAAADQRLNDQIKEQRQEASDLQTHLDNLKQIRDRDASRERDDLLNRNFRDLFALKEQKTQDLNTENDRYSKQEAQRQDAFNQQEQDQSHAQEISRRERLIAYQQANQDAQKQYNIEIAAAQQAKTKAIQVAQQGYNRELQLINTNLIQKEMLLKQDAINQIRLVQQTEDQKTAIFLSKLQQVNQLLGIAEAQNAAPIQHTGSRAVPFADGGYASAGQLTMVNDKRKGQRESFNGVPFPAGLGLFIPSQSGYINSGSGGGPVTLSPTYQIVGVTGEQVSSAIDAKNRKLMKDIGLL